VLTYSYDALNRVILKVVPERAGLTAAQTRDPGSSPGQANDGYDLRNLQLYARFEGPGGPGIANQYDGFGRLVSTSADTDGTARTLAYQYDREGRRTRITHPDGNWFSSDRDGLGRLYYLAAPDNVGRYYSSYRADGLPGGQSRGNGASTWTSRDGVGRLNGLGHYYGQGGTGDVLWLYDFNPASQIRSVNRDNDSYAWTGHYAVNRAYTTNGLNQYTAAGSATFGYDWNGNLTSDGGRTYVYDVENRLVSASTGVTLSYDPLGRLYQVAVSGGATTRFLYDGDALVAEYDGAGTMIRRYVHWDGADVPILSYAGATLATPTYLHADHQGSIVAISTASGATQINRYDEYGIPAATNAGRFQYTGQVWLAELGLYYYKARLYSPTFGRFLQVDPIGYDDQFNLYEYVGDDPINQVDPSGNTPAILGAGAWACWSNTWCRRGIYVLGAWVAAHIIPSPLPNRPIAPVIPQAPGPVLQENSNPAAAHPGRPQPRPQATTPPNLVDDRGRDHILDGDETGGGHRAGTGAPGKSEFPPGWSDDRILGEISDVATDPSADRQTVPGGRNVSRGNRGGVDIQTVDDGHRIITGHPTNRPRNPHDPN